MLGHIPRYEGLSQASLRKLMLLSAWTLSCVGLVWQVHFICDQFLSYKSTTEVTLELARDSPFPNVSIVCVNKLLLRQVDVSNTTVSNMTIGQFAQLFPNSSAIKVGAKAKNMITIRAYVRGWSGMYYILEFFNKSVAKFENITFFDVNFPHTNTTLCEQVKGAVGEEVVYGPVAHVSLPHSGGVLLEHSFQSTRKLTYPYSNCYDYEANGQSLASCFRRCYDDNFAKFHNNTVGLRRKVHLTPNSNYAHLVYELNKTLGNALDSLFQKHCRVLCVKGDSCYSQFYITLTGQKFLTTKKDYITVRVFLPTSPNITCEQVPSMTLTDFVVYVITSLSFWLGFTPLCVTINVSDFFIRKWSRNANQNPMDELRSQVQIRLLKQQVNKLTEMVVVNSERIRNLEN